MTARTRVFACQGTTQLVTALAAAALDQRPASDVLIIHDLYAPSGQHAEFAAVIRKAAEVLHQWERVVYLPLDASPPTIDLLRDAVGVGEVDELMLNCFPSPVGARLVSAFPAARRVSVGDGLGVHFTPAYFRHDTRIWWERLLCWLRPTPPAMRFHEHRLLLPGLFDEPAPPHARCDPKFYRRAFQRLAELIPSHLFQPPADASEVLFLLSSNFSETGRVPLVEELDRYSDLCRQVVKPGAALVIKPHPRDSAGKIAALADRLVARHPQVIVLADPLTFYLPFEAVYAAMLDAHPHLAGGTSALCFSSACLGLEYLYGVPCVIGFGQPDGRPFVPAWRRLRVRHEADLNRALSRIRRGEFGPAPCLLPTGVRT